MVAVSPAVQDVDMKKLIEITSHCPETRQFREWLRISHSLTDKELVGACSPTAGMLSQGL